MTIYRLLRQHVFPDPAEAEADPNGLLAVGGDLSPRRLLLGYVRGIFPWYSEDQPIMWWSPDPRMVLYPGELHVPRSLRRTLNKSCTGRGRAGSEGFGVTLDEAFADVIGLCAESPRPGQDGTWITPDMRAAYVRLHELGHAHSAEAWRNGELAGGVYGVAVGGFFSAESMFYRVDEASKVALVWLVRQLARWGFPLVDCQMHTANSARFGGREVPRAQYLRELDAATRLPGRVGRWQFDEVRPRAGLDSGRGNQ